MSRDIVNGCSGTSLMSGLPSVAVCRIGGFLWVVRVVCRGATVSSGLAFGLVLGPVDCFSIASQPPVRERATNVPTQAVEIPYWRASAPWDRLASTAWTITRYFDIPPGLTMSRDRGDLRRETRPPATHSRNLLQRNRFRFLRMGVEPHISTAGRGRDQLCRA